MECIMCNAEIYYKSRSIVNNEIECGICEDCLSNPEGLAGKLLLVYYDLLEEKNKNKELEESLRKKEVEYHKFMKYTEQLHEGIIDEVSKKIEEENLEE